MAKAFFENPDFVTYARLLWQSHELLREGRDEGPEGDELRDGMDAPGERLSRQEAEAVKGIAADFYSLIEFQSDLQTSPTRDDNLARAVLEARECGRFHDALELLRRRDSHLPPAHRAWLRGTIWRAAKEPSIAEAFFNRAAQLQPDVASIAEMMEGSPGFVPRK
jgi:hypothetical protein